MIKIKFIYLCLVVFFLSVSSGCATNTAKPEADECAPIVDDNEKYSCYLLGLRYYISAQIESDITTWLKFNYPYSNSLLGGATIAIRLDDSGEVSKLKVIESSGDSSFDDALMQAIKNASPFELPEEKKIRSKLQEFAWGIRF